MKENDVPQDNDNVFEEKSGEVQYAIDENGKYTKVISKGWGPKNIVMQSEWDEVNNNIKMALDKVLAKEKSSIYYYMHKNIMDYDILSQYTGFPKRKVKKHCLYKNYSSLKESVLLKYVEVFKLKNIEELNNVG